MSVPMYTINYVQFDKWFLENVFPHLKTPYALLAIERDIQENPADYMLLASSLARQDFYKEGQKKLKIPRRIVWVGLISNLILAILDPDTRIPFTTVKLVALYNRSEALWRFKYKRLRKRQYLDSLIECLHEKQRACKSVQLDEYDYKIDEMIKNLLRMDIRDRYAREELFRYLHLLSPEGKRDFKKGIWLSEPYDMCVDNVSYNVQQYMSKDATNINGDKQRKEEFRKERNSTYLKVTAPLNKNPQEALNHSQGRCLILERIKEK